MKRFLALCVFAATLLAGSIYALPKVISSDAVTTEISQRIERYTGGLVQYAGNPEFGFEDGLTLSLSDFEIIDEDNREQFVTADRVTIKLALLPMLFGNLSAHEYELEAPVLRLTADQTSPSDIFPKDGLLHAAFRASREDLELPSLPGHTLRINNGQVILQTNLTSEFLKDVNGEFTLAGDSGEINVDGDFRWRDKPIALDLSMADGLSLLTGGESDLRVTAVSDGTRLRFDGSGNLISDLFFDGDLNVRGNSLLDVIELTGLRPGDTVFAGGFEVTGQTSGTVSNFEIKEALVSVADNTGRGVLQLTSSADTHHRLSGTLAFDELDLTRLSRSQVDPREGLEINSLNIDFRLSARNMKAGFAEFINVAAAVTSDETGWVFDVGASEYAGGQLTMRTGERLSKTKSLSFLDLNGTDLSGDAISALVPSPVKLTGSVNVTSNLRAKEPYSAFLTQGLDGSVELTATNGTLEGLDVNALFNGDFVNTAPLTWQGKTPFQKMSLNMFFNRTSASVSKGEIVMPSGAVSLLGDIDLEAAEIALQTQTTGQENGLSAKRIYIEGKLAAPTLRLGITQGQAAPENIQMLNQIPVTGENSGISN